MRTPRCQEAAAQCGQSDVPERWSLAWKVLVVPALLPPLVGLGWAEPIPGRSNPGI